VRNLAISEGIDEAIHAFQTTPFRFPVNLIRAHLPLGDLVEVQLGIVAASILLASILGNHCTLTSTSIHQFLILIAFGFPDIVSVDLSFALFDLIVIRFCCFDTRILAPEVLV
jgi:hypothetical protein